MVKISDAVNASFDILNKKISSARFEAELIAGYVLNKDSLRLLMCRDEFVSDDNFEKIRSLSHLRANGMPLAYITGKKEFMSLEFKVSKDVLIPRPETEELVSLVIDFFKDREITITDLCTGSGVICCSLLKFMPLSRCIGADICPLALSVAKENAIALGVSDRAEFIIHDVLNPDCNIKKSDVLVSNPPYIESCEIPRLDYSVKNFEPLISLDGGDDGLMFYRKIIQNINLYLKKGGMVFFEIGYNQGEAVKNLMKEKFDFVKITKDLSGNDRIASGQLA